MNFNKKDLKYGMVVKCRNGEKYVYMDIPDYDSFMGKDGYNELSEYEDNLLMHEMDEDDSPYDIMEVFTVVKPYEGFEKIFSDDEKYLKLIWKRKRKMTIKEVEEQLGYGIELISEEDESNTEKNVN